MRVNNGVCTFNGSLWIQWRAVQLFIRMSRVRMMEESKKCIKNS